MNRCPEPSELLGLLNETCDPEDRERLEDHVGACEACQEQIQNLAVDGTNWDTWEDQIRKDASSWQNRTLIVPKESDPTTWPKVPGYELLSVLGQGGMGVVFKARHLALSRLVALKTLPSEGTQRTELRKRLLREAETLAQLHHPHIVQIFEVLETEESVVLVLEYIQGGSLTDRLRTSTLRPLEAAELVELLARTMHVAHEAGIIHRDLKPPNVLMTDDGKAKIADFGIARQLDVVGETVTGHLMGTPSYLAPEQAQSLPGWVTPAVDVYGLGAILYECLAGRPPFLGANVFETLRQVINEDPVSPSRWQQRIPRDLVTICLKCLQKEKTKRYTSCLELAEDLKRLQSGQPILAKRTSLVRRLIKWTRRHPRVAALSGSLILVLAVLLGVWINFTRELSRVNQELREETLRANREEAEARQAKENADLERRIAESTLRQVSNALRSNARFVPDTTGEGKKLSFLVPAETYGSILHQYRSPQLTAERAQGYHFLGRNMLDTGQDERATYFLRRAAEIQRGILHEKGETPEARFDFGIMLSDAGAAAHKVQDLSEAEQFLNEAVKVLSSPDALPEQEGYLERAIAYRANCLLTLVNIYDIQGRKEEAEKTLKGASKLREQVPNLEESEMNKAVFERIDARLSRGGPAREE